MGDSEKEILNNTSIDDVTVEELTMKTAKTSKGRKKSEKVGFFASMKAETCSIGLHSCSRTYNFRT